MVLLAVDSASPILVASRRSESESVRRMFGSGSCAFSKDAKDMLAGVGALGFGMEMRPVSR
jgi:hypothetical protein